MTIQFTLPDEFVAAAKTLITQVNPANTTPSDQDVVTYVSNALLSGLVGLFPGVVLAAQASLAQQVAAQTAQLKAATLAAMNITMVGS